MTEEDLQTEAYVLKTEQEEGVATFTISIADDDYKFEVWKEGDTAYVEFEECLTWRGQIEVSEPDKDVFKSLVVSDEMTEFLDKWDCDSIKRKKTP